MKVIHSIWQAGCMVLLLWSGMAHAALYTYTDSQGKVFIADHPASPLYRKVFSRFGSSANTGEPAQAAVACQSQGEGLPYAEVVSQVASQVGVAPCLLHAMIRVESAYNPRAVSHKGAQGLMQLIPDTAARFGLKQAFDPANNVRAGAMYIKQLLGMFHNDLSLALAAYNAGEGTVRKYGNTVPPYPETRAYVAQVMSQLQVR